jgi:hypothetical protein
MALRFAMVFCVVFMILPSTVAAASGLHHAFRLRSFLRGSVHIITTLQRSGPFRHFMVHAGKWLQL